MNILKQSCLFNVLHSFQEFNLSFTHSAKVCQGKPVRIKKSTSVSYRESYFCDLKQTRVIGGKGGDGCVAFLRLPRNPLAGPCGGDGGNGGHVIFEADKSIKSLHAVPSVIKGENGGNGMGRDMHGASGKHRVIQVPVGTLVRKEGSILADLHVHELKFIASRGGAGGHGNHFFLSDSNRHPEVAEFGAEGETNVYTLEMKMVADIGLVGFPNAGKSTLLRAISRARPKVASYPFTTLKPHVGMVCYDDHIQISVADLPGLIPDAHKNRGLGISFLRHIEQCSGILFVIDLSDECSWRQLLCLQYEMEQYQKSLLGKPCAIVANKCDLPESEANLSLLKQNVKMPVYPVSAKYGHNIRALLEFIRTLYYKCNKDVL